MSRVSLINISKKINYWLVRAGEDQKHTVNFFNSNVIAIEHLNIISGLKSTDKLPYSPNVDGLKIAYSTAYNKANEHKNKSTRQSAITSKFSQIERFIYEMNIGDIVISVDSNDIRFGEIIGDCYGETEPDVVQVNPKRSIKMDAFLRRDVKWNERVPKRLLASKLLKSLSTRLTVSNVTDHWQQLNHARYPLFSEGADVYFSTRIKAEHDISSYYFNKLGQLLNQLEVVVNTLGDDEIDLSRDYLMTLVEQHGQQGLLRLITKAEVMSPGPYQGRVSLGSLDGIKQHVWGLAIAMLLQQDTAEFESALGSKSSEAIARVELVFKYNDVARIREELDLTLPTDGSSPSKNESLDHKKNKEKKKRRISG